MNLGMLDKPFFEITLPLMLSVLAGVWAMISTNNRRLDDVVKRLERIDDRLGSIDETLREFGQRITRIEERTSPLYR